jgi:hypothetical protein
MGETSTSSEYGLGGEPELSHQGIARGHSGSGEGRYPRSARMVGQTRIRIPRLGLFDLLRCLRAGSPFESIYRIRAVFCIAWIVGVIFSNSPSALAEVEEATSQDGLVSDYIYPALPNNLEINFLVNNYDRTTEAFAESQSTFNAIYNGAELRQYNTDNTNTIRGSGNEFRGSENLDDVLIPATVWTLNVSTGAHFDQSSSDSGYDLDMSLGKQPRASDLWARAILGLWTNADISSDSILLPSLQFQVASCGGSFAEHSDLGYCNIYNNGTVSRAGNSKEGSGRDNINGAITASNDSTASTISSNTTSTPIQETQPDTVNEPSPLMTSSVNDFELPGDLTDANTIPDIWAWHVHHWYDFAADNLNSPTAPIGSPIAPIDSPTAPVDSPTAPVDSPAPPDFPPPGTSISIGDPEPVTEPLPISTPPLGASPVPETSTWIMTLIGFGIIALASRVRPVHPIHHGVVGTFHKLIKKFCLTTPPSYFLHPKKGNHDADA